jgi:hypothetical protein
MACIDLTELLVGWSAAAMTCPSQGGVVLLQPGDTSRQLAINQASCWLGRRIVGGHRAHQPAVGSNQLLIG